jgi:putative copper resistance protein D
MNVALVLSRFVQFASLMTLFGGWLFVSALAPPSLAAELSAPLRRIAAPLALLSLASAVAWLVFVARDMAGDHFDLDALSEVLWGTAFGKVWQARLVILALLVVAALRPDARGLAPALFAGLAVATLGLVGHAAMQDGLYGAAHRLNHALHLLATSAWIGGLAPFLACLTLCRGPLRRRDALEAMRRYSRAGHYWVPLVFVTGALDVAMTTHALPWPPSSPYRVGLCSKACVFLVTTALALVNRYIFAVRAGRAPAAARALGLGAFAEILLGLSAVALVSVFATYDPA